MGGGYIYLINMINISAEKNSLESVCFFNKLFFSYHKTSKHILSFFDIFIMVLVNVILFHFRQSCRQLMGKKNLT